MIYKGKGGIQYNLENNPFAGGGEGKVYNVVGKRDVVAKLYKNGLNDKMKERKLLAMVDNPPSKAVMDQIAWPLDVLYDRSHTFVGFIMPKLAINEDLNVIYEYGTTAKYPNVPWRNKIIIAKNLCAVLDAVHDAGHVVGDLNPKNISVDPQNGHIIFVDTDSYHIEDNGTIYRCNVGMPEYLPVEIQRKMKGGLSSASLPTFTKATDDFALAVHIFQLLMNGTHPFACRVLPSQASVVFPQPTDNIMNGDCPFLQPKAGIDIPVYAPPISILPKAMQDMFKRAFIDGHTTPNARPSAAEWHAALCNLECELRQCGEKSYHEYYNTLNHCPWCEADQKFTSGVSATQKTPLTQSTIPHAMRPTHISAPRTNITGSAYNTSGTGIYGSYTGYGGGTTTRYKSSKKKIVIPIVIAVVVIIAIILGVTLGTRSNKSKPPETICLSTPTSLGVANGEITWDSVRNANSYMVKVNDKEVPVSQNSLVLDSSFDAGNYNISVRAQGATENIIASDYSDVITVTKPSVPVGISLDNGVLSWTAVSDYTAYKVLINGSVVATVNALEYALKDNVANLKVGSNSIGVKVAGNNNLLLDSDLSITKDSVKLSAPLNVGVADEMLSWQKVDGAIGYKIDITNGSNVKSETVGENTYSYYLLGKVAKGTYQISVRALGNNNMYYSSDPSSSVSYTLAETIISLSSKQDLLNISNDLGAKYVLQNDIDISGSVWTPIGTIAARFNGVLIGNGHSIKGLTLTSVDTKGAGFFGVVGESGIINDITFEDVKIDSGTTGYVGAVSGINYGTIFNVVVEGEVGGATSGDYVGGLVGRSYGSIYDCTNKAQVKGATNVGGIAGNFDFGNANMQFSNCVNEGVIVGKTRVGGLVGYARIARLCYFRNLSNVGAVTALNNYAGGICGYTEGVSGQTGNYESCQNSGNVTAADFAGGCFGYVGSYINITLGDVSDPTKNCGNTGTVSATSGHSGNIRGN